MQRCISVSFEFKGKEFYAIVRRRTIQARTYYKIRIMNHRLDALVHKNNANFIDEFDGRLIIPQANPLSEAEQIRLAVANQLSESISEADINEDYAPVKDFRLLTPY